MNSKEALELLKGYKISDMYDSKIPFINKKGFFTMRECVETLEQDLEKLEKVIEILKRENIKISNFVYAIKTYKDIYKENMYQVINTLLDCNLTKEEYELLKEVLDDENS